MKTTVLLVAAALLLGLASAQNFQDIVDGTWSGAGAPFDFTFDLCTHKHGDGYRTSGRVKASDGVDTEYGILVGVPVFDDDLDATVVTGNVYTPGFPIRVFPLNNWFAGYFCFDTDFQIVIPSDPTKNVTFTEACASVNDYFGELLLTKADPRVPSDLECFRVGDKTVNGVFGNGKQDTFVCAEEDNTQFEWSRDQPGGRGIREYANGILYENGTIASTQNYVEGADKSQAGTPRLAFSLYGDSELVVVTGFNQQTISRMTRYKDTATPAQCAKHASYAPPKSGMYTNLFPNMPGTFVCENGGVLNAMYDYVGILAATSANGALFSGSFYEGGSGERTCTNGGAELNLTAPRTMEITFDCADSNTQSEFSVHKLAAGVVSPLLCAWGTGFGGAKRTIAGDWQFPRSEQVVSFWDICLHEDEFTTQVYDYNSSYGLFATPPGPSSAKPGGYEEGAGFVDGTIASGVFYEKRPVSAPYSGYSLIAVNNDGVMLNFYYGVSTKPFSALINGDTASYYWNSFFSEDDPESDGGSVPCDSYSFFKESAPFPTPSPSPTPTPSPFGAAPSPAFPPSPSPSPSSASSVAASVALVLAAVALVAM